MLPQPAWLRLRTRLKIRKKWNNSPTFYLPISPIGGKLTIMEKTRALAMFTVGRAVFFGSLAVSLIMLSFLFDMVLFFRSGAILAFGMSAILLWYAQTATQRPPKRTETWLLLEDDLRPRNQHAIRAFTILMEEVYTYYTRHVFLVGLCLFIASLLCQLFGIHSVFDRIA